jgi:hypothetical protein
MNLGESLNTRTKMAVCLDQFDLAREVSEQLILLPLDFIEVVLKLPLPPALNCDLRL